MGLLESLGYGNQGGYGGLLDALMYPSPLMKPAQPPEQPQYDIMGTPFAAAPQAAADPFGPVPQVNLWAQQFAPKAAQPFNVGAAPIANFTPPAAQPVQPPAPPAAPVTQVNDLSVGGYQMPRMGSVADYTPQPTASDFSAQSRAPQPTEAPSAQPQSLPPAFGGGSVLGRLFNPDGLVARLTGNDSRSVAQQNLKAQYDSLVPVLGPQKAMLAVLNPKAAETLIPQALEKKKYSFQKLDSDTIVNQDPDTGRVTRAYGSDETSAGVAGPDGKMIPYPAGLDSTARKAFANHIATINADAAAGKKTGEQATAEIFANKMELSNKTLDALANQGTSLTGRIASGLPLGNYIQSPEYQKYRQASSNFITALLRKESGAAIGKQEFDRYDKEYMPQPGDSAEVLAQKTEARRVAIESMKKGAGPGYKSPSAPSLPAGWSVSVR